MNSHFSEVRIVRVTNLWALAATMSAGLAAIAGLLLHVVGTTSHSARLQFWGIDDGIFPKSIEWVLMYGYFSSLEALIAVWKHFQSHYGLYAVSILVVVVYFTLLRVVAAWNPKAAPVIVKSHLLAVAIRTSFYVTFGCLIPILMMPVLIIVLVGPAAVGQEAGKRIADGELQEFRKGCAGARRQCVEVWRGDQLLARGFLVESSGSNLAVFDVKQGRTRTLAREGTELLGGIVALRVEN